jgi:hypothetical protein
MDAAPRNGTVPCPSALAGTGPRREVKARRGPAVHGVTCMPFVVGAQRSLAVTGKWQPRELHYFVLNYALQPGDVIEMHIRASRDLRHALLRAAWHVAFAAAESADSATGCTCVV